MRKYKIYLDTSTISCLDQTESPERKRDSEELWEMFREGTTYEVVVSDLTLHELARCEETKRDLLRRRLDEISVHYIAESKEIEELADYYLKNGVLSEKSYDDLLHIAFAVVHGCDYIAS